MVAFEFGLGVAFEFGLVLAFECLVASFSATSVVAASSATVFVT